MSTDACWAARDELDRAVAAHRSARNLVQDRVESRANAGRELREAKSALSARQQAESRATRELERFVGAGQSAESAHRAAASDHERILARSNAAQSAWLSAQQSGVPQADIDRLYTTHKRLFETESQALDRKLEKQREVRASVAKTRAAANAHNDAVVNRMSAAEEVRRVEAKLASLDSIIAERKIAAADAQAKRAVAQAKVDRLCD